MAIAVLAILKAGCVYVPFDPASPPARLRDDSYRRHHRHLDRRAFANTAADLIAQAPTALTHVYIGINADLFLASSLCGEANNISSLAYIIFTSGTLIPRHSPSSSNRCSIWRQFGYRELLYGKPVF
jgi:non-ribosomal peptide synthetase component F